MKLQQYFKDKYFSFFDLSDEVMYLDTKDLEVLKSKFAKFDFIISSVSHALSDFKALPGEVPDSLAARIEELLKNKFGPKDQS